MATVDPKIFPSSPSFFNYNFPICHNVLLLSTEGTDSAAKTSKLVSGWGGNEK